MIAKNSVNNDIDERFMLEKGPHVGNFLHYVFEHIDLSRLEDDPHIDSELISQMKLNGVALGEDNQWVETYKRWLIEAAATPIIGHTSLRDISRSHWLAEMEFLVPISGTLTAAKLNSIVSPFIDFELDFAPVSGHLVGHIDLIFQHDNQFFVADYKSNHLGYHFFDYKTESIHSSMRHSGYTLQYLIYCVGLHRHLRLNIENYQFDHHFGGVFYLYLRGMHPDHPGHGVFFDRPSFELIEQLDHLFAQGEFHA